jgi:hypothetical protein
MRLHWTNIGYGSCLISGIDPRTKNSSSACNEVKCLAQNNIVRKVCVTLSGSIRKAAITLQTWKKFGLLAVIAVRITYVLFQLVFAEIVPLADVGGGAVKNPFRHKLARIPLRWMVRQCFLLKTGILFHREMFKVIGVDPDTLHPVVKPRPPPVRQLSVIQRLEYKLLPPGARGKTVVDIESDYVSEEEEDLADAMSPINDMLKIAKTWWILEFIPQNLRFQLDDDSWTQQIL